MFKNTSQEFVYIRTYSRWIEELKRRETWEETVNRYINFIKESRGELIPEKVLRKIKENILSFNVMPSMRAMWAAGPAAKSDNLTMYNCSFVTVDSVEAFHEGLYILMNGTGLGFSVENKYISKLPSVPIIDQFNKVQYTVEDSRAGWASSVKALIESLYLGKDLEIDYSFLRPKGSRLLTMGGRSGGGAPLVTLHSFIRETFYKAQGRQLTSLECHDLMNQIAEIVVVGGTRRSSEISLSDLNDEEMRNAKNWPFPVKRAMANNSAVYLKKPSAVEFLKEWSILASSGTGERGVFNLESARETAPERRVKSLILGTNPCGEISLRNKGLCNLSEVVIKSDDDLDSLLDKVECATWIGAIQSTFTHFPYLSKEWKQNCEEERLLGVSLTGQMDNPKVLTPDALRAMKSRALKIAKHAAQKLNINVPTAVTCVKPSGCRPYDGLVTTGQGLYTLEDLLEKHHSSVLSEWALVNDYDTLGAGRITKTYINGLSEVFKIKMSLGMEVESTSNHMWYIKNKGFIQTKDIEIGDEIEITSNLYNKTSEKELVSINKNALHVREDVQDINQPKHMSPDLSWLLGYLWGDGAMSPAKFRLRFTDAREENLLKAQLILKQQFNLDSKIHKASENRKAKILEISSKLLWHWLIKNNVWKYYADNIDLIPLIVRESSKESVIAFLSGLYDADGWYDQLDGAAMLTTASELFANHIQHIGWTVGICFGKSHNTKGENFQKQKNMFLMNICTNSDNNSLQLFKKHSNKVIGALRAENKRKVYRPGVVRSIESSGIKPTFDVETDEHWFYAGSVRSHNTVSQVTDSASGIHPRYDQYYIRRYRISSTDPLYKMLKDQKIYMTKENGQESLEDNDVNTWIVSFPMKSPKGCITKDKMSALDQLEMYKKVQTNWCEHNTSMTVYVKDEEWFEVGNWVYQNWNIVNGISFLPFDGGKYKQAPYESITKEQYEKLIDKQKSIDYTQLSKYEQEDTTEGAKSLACSGDKCELI